MHCFFAISYCLRHSQGKNTEVVCHSLLQYWERLKAGGEGDERMRRLDGITNSMDMSEQALGVGDGQERLA